MIEASDRDVLDFGPRMARRFAALSDEDKSVLIAALDQDELPTLLTTTGSENDTLWIMFKQIGWLESAELEHEGVAYRLTDLGRISIPQLIQRGLEHARQKNGEDHGKSH